MKQNVGIDLLINHVLFNTFESMSMRERVLFKMKKKIAVNVISYFQKAVAFAKTTPDSLLILATLVTVILCNQLKQREKMEAYDAANGTMQRIILQNTVMK